MIKTKMLEKGMKVELAIETIARPTTSQEGALFEVLKGPVIIFCVTEGGQFLWLDDDSFYIMSKYAVIEQLEEQVARFKDFVDFGDLDIIINV